MNESKERKREPEKKEYDFDYCPKHGTRYPKGSKCPRCEQEKRKK